MQYKLLRQLVQNVIDSATNIAVAHLNGLKQFLQTTILKVQVQNPQTSVDVTGKVSITNQKPVINAIKGIPIAINSLKKATTANKEVKVTNLKDIKIPPFPKFPSFPKEFRVSNPQKEVKITNMREFTSAVEKVAEFIAKIKYDPRIEVSPTPVNVKAPVVNVPEQKPPVVNVEPPDLSEIVKALEYFNKLTAKNPMPVRLSDGTKYYKALEKMAEIYAGSTFSAFQDVDGNDGRAILNRNNEVRVTVADTWDVNDVDKVDDTTTYFGEESVDGKWRVRKVVKSGTLSSVRHATIRNNESYNGYEDAWTDRASLEYGYAREAL